MGAVNLVKGKLGTGKSKFCVWLMREAIRAGRRVATNYDLQLVKLVPERQRATYIRVPDKPTAADLFALGHGNPDSYDEERNGVLVLDECATWLNARSFQDKERAALLDWLVHARKHGWEVYFICQNEVQIDRQVRESLVEYEINLMRFDKVRIPVVGWFLDAFGRGRLPRFHVASYRLGSGPNALVAERKMFRGDELHEAYDTRQVFRYDPDAASHSVLSAEWFAPKRPALCFVDRLLIALRGSAPGRSTGADPASLKPKLPIVSALAVLPPDQRVRAARRLIASGAV